MMLPHSGKFLQEVPSTNLFSINDRGRDDHYWSPPAETRTSAL